MKKILFLLSLFNSFSAYSSLRGGCPSYESEYGVGYLQDLTQTPVLAMIKDDLESSNLLGNIHFTPYQNQTDYIYYQNGNIFSKTPFQNFKKNGVQEFFYENQNLLSSIPYQNDQINGTVRVFYIDGSIKMTLTYQNGKKIGTGEMFFQNGQTMLKESYQDGKINGIQYQYYPNGILQSSISYKNGIFNGPSKLYYMNGDVLASLLFENGEIVQNICYPVLGEQSQLNDIALYKLKFGMRPINCFSASEALNY